MPLDTSIPLRAVAGQQDIDILTPIARISQLRGLAQQQRLGELKLEEAARQTEERQALRDVFGRHVQADTIGSDAHLRDLATVSPEAYYGALEQRQAQRKAQQDAVKAQADLAKTMAEIQKLGIEQKTKTLDMMRDVNTDFVQRLNACIELGDTPQGQACYERSKAEARQKLQGMGLPTIDIDSLPDKIDVQLLNEKRMGLLSTKDQLDEVYRSTEIERKVAEQKALASGRITEEVQKQQALMAGEVEEARRKEEALQPFKLGRIEAQGKVAEKILQTGGGYLRYNPETGGVEPILGPGGEPLRPKPTEGQQTAMGFGVRASAANDIVNRLEAQGVNSADAKFGLVGQSPFGNYLLTGEQQQYRQAMMDFVRAVLRKESGAAIAEDEFRDEARRFFPQPGDMPGVIAQKRQARALALKVLEEQAGRPLPTLRQEGGSPAPQQPTQPAPAQPASPAPAEPPTRQQIDKTKDDLLRDYGLRPKTEADLLREFGLQGYGK